MLRRRRHQARLQRLALAATGVQLALQLCRSILCRAQLLLQTLHLRCQRIGGRLRCHVTSRGNGSLCARCLERTACLCQRRLIRRGSSSRMCSCGNAVGRRGTRRGFGLGRRRRGCLRACQCAARALQLQRQAGRRLLQP